MTLPCVLAGTWDNGLIVMEGGGMRREQHGEPVTGLVSDGEGGALAIVSGRSLCRRKSQGDWQILAMGEGLVCCTAVGQTIYVGTDDAQILVLSGRDLKRLEGFDHVAGRERWYAGTALVDGKVMGPPLGIRSMTANSAGTILANVHVGGIPRSVDGGLTWHPTIDIEADVHQVCAHPSRPEIIAAAAAIGLCLSRDGGATWSIERDGMHSPYCSAVQFVGDDIYVSSSDGPFAEQGEVYRRPIDAQGPLRVADGGLPRWFDGRVDTDNIAARGAKAALADGVGNLYLSDDAGATWAHCDRIGMPSSLLVC